jgi:formylglycine-generating enzyme required for sulfatase activity
MNKFFKLAIHIMAFMLTGCGPNVRGTPEEHKSDQTSTVNDSIQTIVVNDSVQTSTVNDSIQPLMVNDSVPADSVLTFTVNGVSFNMVAVEGSTFTMGATSEQQGIAYDWEKPTHSVTLSDFSIGETEVTEELWYAVMGESQYSRCKNKNLPVAHVSWNDCQEFITQLNQLTGKNFRLPTEAEWEYAARGGKESMGYRYAGSNTLSEVAWYTGNSENVTHTVKQKQPNELGLYDMSGNVWEWCQDWYGDYYSFEETNPTGPPAASYRVRRGGGSCYNARDCRTSVRDRYNPAYSENNLGLRLALTIKVLPSTKPVVTKKITTQTFAVNGVSFTMVDVEGGTFMMGANNTRYNESPSHSVTLSDFSIGETEVTQELWQAVMGISIQQQTEKLNYIADFHGIGNDNPMYYFHYVAAGKAEGRKGHA